MPKKSRLPKSRTLASDNLAHRLETFDISRLRRLFSTGWVIFWVGFLVGKDDGGVRWRPQNTISDVEVGEHIWEVHSARY